MSKRPSQESVIAGLFPDAVCLLLYCECLTSGNGVKLIRKTDRESYRKLLHDSFILPASKDYARQLRGSFVSPPNSECKYPIRDTISRLVGRLVRTNGNGNIGKAYNSGSGSSGPGSFNREQNVLALGYRQKSFMNKDTALMRGNIDLECYFVNTVRTLVTTQAWETLASRVGEELLQHLLCRPIFTKAENDCYIQVTSICLGLRLHSRFNLEFMVVCYLNETTGIRNTCAGTYISAAATTATCLPTKVAQHG